MDKYWLKVSSVRRRVSLGDINFVINLANGEYIYRDISFPTLSGNGRRLMSAGLYYLSKGIESNHFLTPDTDGVDFQLYNTFLRGMGWVLTVNEDETVKIHSADELKNSHALNIGKNTLYSYFPKSRLKILEFSEPSFDSNQRRVVTRVGQDSLGNFHIPKKYWEERLNLLYSIRR